MRGEGAEDDMKNKRDRQANNAVSCMQVAKPGSIPGTPISPSALSTEPGVSPEHCSTEPRGCPDFREVLTSGVSTE